MTCKDVMTSDPKSCVPDDNVVRAAQIMKEENVGPVPVVNDRSDKRLVGIITDRDIAVKVVAAGKDASSTKVSEVMAKDPVYCRVDEDYSKAVQTMARNQVRRIPVVNENGTLAGIISQADVARQSEHEAGHLVGEVSEPSGIRHAIGSLSYRPVSEPETTGFGATGMMLMSAACLAVGAGVMYLADPNRGRSRRARLRDQATTIYRNTAEYANKAQQEVRDRASGLVGSE